MFNGHFYHAITRKAVAVFGTLFNNISVVKTDASGNVKDITKVPLAYGPRQKFLSRIDEQSDLSDPKVAIKLPRMSFEITNFQYDSSTITSPHNKMSATNSNNSVRSPAPYIIDMQLNILAKNQDDALQILEQIIPTFKPSYNISAILVEDMPPIDIPITLQNVSIMDDYEGDFTSRRVLMYTIDFSMKVRYYDGIQEAKIIKKVITNFYNKNNNEYFETMRVTAGDLTAKAVAIVDQGQVSEINVVDSGMKYTSAPTVTIQKPAGAVGINAPEEPTYVYGAGAEVSVNADADSNTIIVDDSSGYQVGDTIAFAESTPHYTVALISGNIITLSEDLVTDVTTGTSVYSVEVYVDPPTYSPGSEVLFSSAGSDLINIDETDGYAIGDLIAFTESTPHYTITQIVDSNIIRIDQLLPEAISTGTTLYSVTLPEEPPTQTYIQARAEANINAEGQVTSIDLLDPGMGYTSVPKVTISAPEEATFEDMLAQDPTVSIDFIPSTSTITVDLAQTSLLSYQEGEIIVGDQSGSQGIVQQIDNVNYTVVINNIDGYPLVGENLVGTTSLHSQEVIDYSVE